MLNTERVVRGLIGLSLGLAVSLSTPPSFAKDSDASANSKNKKKVLVGAFTGAKSDSVRKAVIDALKEDGAYDVSESSEVKPGSDQKSYAKGSAGASAVLVGTVKKTGLVLSVRNGADGALVQDVEIKGDSPAKLDKNIADTLGLSVAEAIGQTKAGAASTDTPKGDAEEPESEAEEKAPEEATPPEPVSDASAAPSGLSALELTAGLRAVHRSFSYHDTPDQLFPQRPTLLKAPVYTLPLGPAVFIDAAIYPLAFGSRGAGALFGIAAGYEVNFATKSVYGTPERTLTTRASQFYAGLKARLPLAAHEVGLLAAYGQQTFNLIGDEANAQVPDVSYKFIRLGAEGRLRFDSLSLGLHVGTRLVTDTGGLERDWFPGHTQTQSLEAGLSAGFTVASGLDLVCGVDLVRYAFNFNPNPPPTADGLVGNPYTQVIAGGAVDQYISGSLGLRYSLPGAAP